MVRDLRARSADIERNMRPCRRLRHVTGAYRFMESFFQTYDEARPHLICRLACVSAVQLLAKAPHVRGAADLEAVVCLISGERETDGRTCRSVTLEEQDRWGIGTMQLAQDALDNMRRLFPPVLRPMSALMDSGEKGSVWDMFRSLLKGRFPGAAEGRLDAAAHLMTGWLDRQIRARGVLSPMWVLGNTAWFHGAVSLLYPDVLQSFAQETGHSCYILPASVNEVILLPKGREETRELLYGMVASANRQMEDRESYLSDSVYYFDRRTGDISVL